jgi:tellurite resistance-related uncharacterized protein
MVNPYRSTPVFDETTLPAALRGEHRAKAGVWHVIRVIEGQVALRFFDQDPDLVLSPGSPGFILPDQPHSIAPLGRMRVQVDFYNAPPDGEQSRGADGA